MSLFKTLAGLSAAQKLEQNSQDIAARDRALESKTNENDALRARLREQQFEIDHPRVAPPSQNELALEEAAQTWQRKEQEHSELLARPFEYIATQSPAFRTNFEAHEVAFAELTVDNASVKELLNTYADRLGVNSDQLADELALARLAVSTGLSRFSNNVDPHILDNLDIAERNKKKDAEIEAGMDAEINEFIARVRANRNT